MPDARLRHIDLLRVALTVGVIAVHALISYGAPGSWLYRAGELPAGLVDVLTVPLAVGALFGMGAFFFVAGAFLPRSLQRHGLRRFVTGRLVRLGLPLLIFVLLAVPLIRLWIASTAGPEASAADLWRRQLREPAPGPLWFVGVLLLFSTVTALILNRLPPPYARALSPRLLALTALAVAVSSFALRLVFPLDSKQIGDAHLWQWGQCLGLFTLGVIAGRQGWLTHIPPAVRRAYLLLTLTGIVAVTLLLAYGGDDFTLYAGFRRQAALLATIEGVVSVSATVALVDLFRGLRPGRRLGALAGAAYGAYLLQAPVLVGLALALRDAPAPAWAKLLFVLPTGVALSFALAHLLRQAPLLRRVL